VAQKPLVFAGAFRSFAAFCGVNAAPRGQCPNAPVPGRSGKNGLAKSLGFPRVCALFMTGPLFVEVQDTLLNLAFVESCYVEETTLYVAVHDEVHEFEYDDESQSVRALLELRNLLTTRNLLLGSVK